MNVGRTDASGWNIRHYLLMVELTTPGKRMLALRKRVPRLTAQEAATAVGISRSHLSMIENDGDLPGRDTLQAIADYYRVSVDYILNGGDATPQSPSTREIVDDPDELAWLGLWRGWEIAERRLALKMLRPSTGGDDTTQD